jgi:hypothetical protein
MQRRKITSALRAADLMRAGGVLMQMHERHGGLAWFIVPGGEVTTTVAEELLRRPDCQPNRDGLFPGISQTFKLGRQR